jgi:hypothetical protein
MPVVGKHFETFIKNNPSASKISDAVDSADSGLETAKQHLATFN